MTGITCSAARSWPDDPGLNGSARRFVSGWPSQTRLRTCVPMQEPFLRISAPDTLMAMMLIGHVSWNIADAALFLDYERRPNAYDPTVYALLNFLKV